MSEKMDAKESYKLTATFEFNLPSPILVNCPLDSDLTYFFTIDDYAVELKLISLEGWSSQSREEPNPTFGVDQFLVSVTHVEDEMPPPIIITPEGHHDFTGRSPYFHQRLPNYQRVARDVFERAILYFKYKLRQPQLNIGVNPQEISNPIWTDELKQKLTVGGIYLVAEIHGLSPILGTKWFTKDTDAGLLGALSNRINPDLYETLLSDSQTAYYEGNLRRAILELAISCETMVKQFFFTDSPLASSIFEYIDESQRSLNVKDLIGNCAKRALGESFKDAYGDDFQNIDFLFRCRNKIAHRGEIKYRDDSGNLQIVDKEKFVSWWDSLEKLKTWLDSYRS